MKPMKILRLFTMIALIDEKITVDMAANVKGAISLLRSKEKQGLIAIDLVFCPGDDSYTVLFATADSKIGTLLDSGLLDDRDLNVLLHCRESLRCIQFAMNKEDAAAFLQHAGYEHPAA